MKSDPKLAEAGQHIKSGLPDVEPCITIQSTKLCLVAMSIPIDASLHSFVGQEIHNVTTQPLQR